MDQTTPKIKAEQLKQSTKSKHYLMIILKLSPTENTAKEIVWLWEKDEILRQKWENKGKTVVEEGKVLRVHRDVRSYLWHKGKPGERGHKENTCKLVESRTWQEFLENKTSWTNPSFQIFIMKRCSTSGRPSGHTKEERRCTALS